MDYNYTEEELVKIAKKRVKLKRNLMSHISSYFIINAFLILIYFIFDNDKNGRPWFLWPLAIWGVLLLLDIVHTIQNLSLTYNYNAVNKEVEKIKRKINKGR